VVNCQYQYNTAGQRTRMTMTDGSYWVYGYDALGQLTGANKFFWDGTPMPGQQFGFAFDTTCPVRESNLGPSTAMNARLERSRQTASCSFSHGVNNRTATQVGGDQNGANLRQSAYANSLLNQTTNRTVPGYVDVLGSTLAANTVSVNGQTAYQKWQYFWKELPVSNGSGALWANMSVTAPGQTAVSGNVFVPQTPENYGYDLDGNETSDGRFGYTWDGENRVVHITSLSGAPTASWYKLDLTYDYMGRRIQKVVSTYNGTSWVTSYTYRFVYDGWNVVAILDANNNLLYSFNWGLDLSGSMQGAGGVGGLISMTVYGPNPATYFYCYDGNGNVVALVNAANGTVAANWEYGPFGEVIRATGPMAKVNPFLFSTKFYDWESGLYYYGARYYNQSTGRWLSKDPAEEEEGGPNLYAFAGNDALDHADDFGLWRIKASSSDRRAVAWPKYGDTVRSLAKLRRLSTYGWQKWLQGPAVPFIGLDTPLVCFARFTIPNTVYVDIGTHIPKPTSRNIGEWMAYWIDGHINLNFLSTELDALLGGGVMSLMKYDVEITHDATGTDLMNHLSSTDIAGFMFAGHSDGSFLDSTDRNNALYMTPAWTKYGIALMWNVGCDTADNGVINNWRQNVSTTGQYIGYKGSLRGFISKEGKVETKGTVP
jgi:RHS repeat-associated protein